jgi:hypothetical protein
MTEAPLMTGLGIAIGLPAAFALSQVARSWIFGLTPYDPLALTIATVADRRHTFVRAPTRPPCRQGRSNGSVAV